MHPRILHHGASGAHLIHPLWSEEIHTWCVECMYFTLVLFSYSYITLPSAAAYTAWLSYMLFACIQASLLAATHFIVTKPRAAHYKDLLLPYLIALHFLGTQTDVFLPF